MLICPMCKKTLAERVRECPRCRADLSILVDYVTDLQGGLTRAEAFTRAGNLGEAVWAYLEVLEVDPDNGVAGQQVKQVAAAVRQFDRVAIGRRWLDRLQRQARFRRWMASWQSESASPAWLGIAAVLLLLAIAFLLGYSLGRHAEPRPVEEPAVQTAAPES
jgi:hypothetical protein